MKFINVDEHLSYIDVFDSLSTWVYKDENLCFLVDPGPMIYVNYIKRGLKKLGVGEDNLDYILLTHIHIDHAGGVSITNTYFFFFQVLTHLSEPLFRKIQ